jgi:hypothetical protein
MPYATRKVKMSPTCLPDTLLDREVAALCASYRIAPEEARALCLDYIQRRPDLLRTLESQSAAQDVTRLSAYKTLMKAVRKHVYYHLRQYQPDKQTVAQLRQQLAAALAAAAPAAASAVIVRQLLASHVSTCERLAHYAEFYAALFRLIERPRTILDVGCGLHPLSYPYAGDNLLGFVSQEWSSPPEHYVAIDRQADVIDTVRVFAPFAAPTHVTAVCADLGTIDWRRPPVEEWRDGEAFDLALLLKLVPVIARQQRHVLPTLAALPARQILITATSEAMTRRQNIRRREERVLRDFVELTGRRIQTDFHVGPEFGFLLA